jgi:glutathione S-transferase
MARPVLWNIPVSHYAEKVRWALAYKDVEHVRRAPPPGLHMPVAAVLTHGRGVTFPVLSIDGRHIGDSTDIIAALEEAHPEPPLFPADPAGRRRALELEDFFDEELGPYVRQATFNELRSDPAAFQHFATAGAPPPLRRFGPALGAYARAYTAVRWKASDDEGAQRSRAKVRAAVDRLERELGDGEYLVGGRFTVADLTAASLFYPVVLPEGGPLRRDTFPRDPELRTELADRPGLAWVEEMYRRHRRRTRRPAAGQGLEPR